MNYSSTNLRRLYFRLPLSVRSFMATVYGFMQRKRRYGTVFSQTLADLRISQTVPTCDLINHRDLKTINFIQKVSQTVPFYNNDTYKSVKTIADIRSLPIVSKSILRDSIEQFYNSQEIPHSSWAHTSGTTGRSIVFPLSKECFQREYAFRALHYEWGGISLHGRQKVAFCAGHPVADTIRDHPPFWVYDYANNWLFMSSYHLSKQNMKAYVKELEAFRPEMIGGYPSSMYLLALANSTHGSGVLQPKAVFCSSETLMDHQREAIEKSFNCKVYNWYGNSEMCANIVECECGELHLKLEHSYVEVLNDSNQPCEPGQTGRLVCTGFGNSAFPLIRYDMGDVVTICADQHAKCGRSGILIERVQGRIEDYIVTPEGRVVGRLDHLFKDSQGIHEAQLIQNETDSITIRYVKSASFTTKDIDIIMSEARLRLGPTIRIHFEEVPIIERTRNGKFRFIISTISQTDILRKLKDMK